MLPGLKNKLTVPSLLLSGNLLHVVAIGTLQVETTVGRVYGMINGSNPDVAQFLGVPFAEPPINELRFKPPVAKSPVSSIDATRIGPSCMQYILNTTNSPSVYTFDTPWLQPYGTVSEDCLTLDILAPFSARNFSSEPLPVLVWVFGGGFYEGGLMTNGMQAGNWIQRSQTHIVVAINYRVNIFGFPNARGINITEQNLGLLDQRVALEWVRDNIAAFGGDVSRITMWGQSSGAASTDQYNYAYPDDPIVSGIIQHSGSVFATGTNHDAVQSNFTFVAQQFGCGNLSAVAEVDCLRNVSAQAIEDFYEDYSLNIGSLTFNPIVDNRTKFGAYTARAYAGNYSKVPAIIGTNANEEASLLTWAGPQGPDPAYIYNETITTHLCPNSYATRVRYNTSSITYRYFNTANFSNISPRPWEGAYHTSELPLLFGTFSDYGSTPATALEYAVSTRWQDLYLAFMRDPVSGPLNMGWPRYGPNSSVMRFGHDGTVSDLVSVSEVEAPCATIVEDFA